MSRDADQMQPLPWPLPVHAIVEIGTRRLTPFNLVPVGPVEEVRKLMVLACLPMHGFGGAGFAPGWPPQLRIDFWRADQPVELLGGVGGVLWWVRSLEGVRAPESFRVEERERLILVVDDDGLEEEARAVGDRLRLAEIVVAGAGGADWVSLPTRLYTAIVRHQAKAAPGAFISAPNLWSPFAEPEASGFSMDEWVAAAKAGDSSPALHVRRRQQLSGDLLVRTNQMLRAHGLGQVPDLDLSCVPLDPEAEAAALARSVLELRRRRSTFTFLAQVGRTAGSDVVDIGLAELGERVGDLIQSQLREALHAKRVTYEGKRTLERLLVEESPWNPNLVVPQLVFACPSSSVDFARGSTYQRASDGATRLEPEFDLQDEYVVAVLDAVANARGRNIPVPPPETPAQEASVASVIATLKAEAGWLSYSAFQIGARFGAPVLKTRRVPVSMLRQLREPAEQLELLSSSSGHAAWIAAAESVRAVGEEVSTLLPDAYGQLLDELPSPWIHCLSDIPLELLHRHGDYLAYQAALSRTPITPGITATQNAYATVQDVPLPAAGSKVVIATPFDEDEAPMSSLLAGTQEMFPNARLELVTDAGAFGAVMEDPSTALVIYVGHGMYDDENEESVLFLRDDTFGTFGVRSLDRVPPLVLLVGCETSGAGSTIGSLATALLVGGARAVVGTAYPVRQSIAYQMLLGLLRQLTTRSPDRPIDLARALLVTRRNLRMFSDLGVLVQAGLASQAIAEDLRERFVAAVGAEPSDPQRANLLPLETKLLGDAELIDPGSPPSSWGIVPYPAFFSVLGLPWTTLRQEQPEP